MWVGYFYPSNRLFALFQTDGWCISSQSMVRTIMIVAVAVAIVSTQDTLCKLDFHLAHVENLWGLAFSAMRVGTIATLFNQKRQGFLSDFPKLTRGRPDARTFYHTFSLG